MTARLNIDRATVYRTIWEELPALRIGDRSGPLRVDEAELEQWLYSPGVEFRGPAA